MGRLAGRSALVTGASRGVGRALALTLAREGAELVVTSRGGRALREVADAAGADPVEADLSRLPEIDCLVEGVRRRFDAPPDILVNAAACRDLVPMAQLPLADFERHVRVNLIAAFALVRALLPGMMSRGSGHLVLLGPVAAPAPAPGAAAYRASKLGLAGLHDVLALELAGTGVRATLLEPPAGASPDAVCRALLARLLSRDGPGGRPAGAVRAD